MVEPLLYQRNGNLMCKIDKNLQIMFSLPVTGKAYGNKGMSKKRLSKFVASICFHKPVQALSISTENVCTALFEINI